ncbi:MAG: hypothetical protein WBP47_17965, partial [Candidatus Promineifilaceae bacterium]
ANVEKRNVELLPMGNGRWEWSMVNCQFLMVNRRGQDGCCDPSPFVAFHERRRQRPLADFTHCPDNRGQNYRDNSPYVTENSAKGTVLGRICSLNGRF